MCLAGLCDVVHPDSRARKRLCEVVEVVEISLRKKKTPLCWL